MILEPDWYKNIISLNEEDLDKFKKRLEKSRKENIYCECKEKIVEPSSYCVKCWKYIKDYHSSDFFWFFPDFYKNLNRWWYIDKEMNNLLLGKTQKFEGKICPLVFCRSKVWEGIRYGLFIENGGKCNDCGKEVNGEYEIHHIIPDSQGGTEILSNLKLLCKECHSKYFLESLPEL